MRRFLATTFIFGLLVSPIAQADSTAPLSAELDIAAAALYEAIELEAISYPNAKVCCVISAYTYVEKAPEVHTWTKDLLHSIIYARTEAQAAEICDRLNTEMPPSPGIGETFSKAYTAPLIECLNR
ncbi:MAG: hypothetical protein KDD44_01030 [Bdellovibrionales bacterium]|nr:hypothetical protein [Bdellovibrionales bacterium]